MVWDKFKNCLAPLKKENPLKELKEQGQVDIELTKETESDTLEEDDADGQKMAQRMRKQVIRKRNQTVNQSFLRFV